MEQEKRGVASIWGVGDWIWTFLIVLRGQEESERMASNCASTNVETNQILQSTQTFTSKAYPLAVKDKKTER